LLKGTVRLILSNLLVLDFQYKVSNLPCLRMLNQLPLSNTISLNTFVIFDVVKIKTLLYFFNWSICVNNALTTLILSEGSLNSSRRESLTSQIMKIFLLQIKIQPHQSKHKQMYFHRQRVL
jgi:hypothetical protein